MFQQFPVLQKNYSQVTELRNNRMKLKFTKMHGIGNDFVVIDAINQHVSLCPDQIRAIADRHFGIGCDQILLVEKATNKADFRYRIFNADGSEVEQCGNGARCFIRFIYDHGLTKKNDIRIETLSGEISPKLEANGEITVNMGVPQFEPANIPFAAEQDALVYQLELDGKEVEISIVSMGNPHAVRIIQSISQAPVLSEGPMIESHPRFPNRVNVGYMKIIDRNHIKLRVYERGSGETLACGTGACAAVVTGIRLNLLATIVKVSTRGGDLTIRWEGSGKPVWMTGPAVTVFDGEINL